MKKLFKALLVIAICFGIVGCTKSVDKDGGESEEVSNISSNDQEDEEEKDNISKEEFKIDYYFFNNDLRWNMSYEEASS